MGSHNEAAAIAAGIHAVVFGDGSEITYARDAESTPAEITAIAHAARTEQRPTSSGTISVEVRMVAVQFTSLADPVIHGIITIDDVPWSIESIDSDSSRWLLNCTKTNFVERTRNNYRRAGR